jgi:hypothetical protein
MGSSPHHEKPRRNRLIEFQTVSNKSTAMQLSRPQHCTAAVQELGADAFVLKKGHKTVGVSLPSQSVMAHLGEWIVRHEDGRVESMVDAEFRTRFEPAAA